MLYKAISVLVYLNIIDCSVVTMIVRFHSEAVCKSVLSNLLSKVERQEEKDKQRLQITPNQKRRFAIPTGKKSTLNQEVARKLKRTLRERKDRLVY